MKIVKTSKKNLPKKLYSKSIDVIQMRKNSLVLRRDPLTEVQRKTVALMASKVRFNDTYETIYTISAVEYAELCNLEKRETLYKRIFKEICGLQRCTIAFEYDDDNIAIGTYMWDVSINKTTATISYRIPPKLLPHFKLGKKDDQSKLQFAKLDLLEYVPLKGQYSLLLYELLMSWRGAGKVYYTIEALRRLLEVPEGIYPKPNDLLRRTVFDTVPKINEQLKDGEITYIVKYNYSGKQKLIEGIAFNIPQSTEPPSKKGEPTEQELEDAGQQTIFNAMDQQAATSDIGDPRCNSCRGKGFLMVNSVKYRCVCAS